MPADNLTISTHQLPQPGRAFGRFHVLELIGRGGMGQIFKVQASDKPEDGPIALKVVVTPNLSRVDRLRFEREFQLTSQFHHPNLVEVYEFGAVEGTTYYTMEWIKGVDIDTAFEKERTRIGGGELPSVAVRWIDGLLSGLQTLHEAGIVHRDLKPENILIDSTGQAKLLDLGLASHFSDQSSVSRLTVPGAVLGTIHFMAPEQVIGADIDPRADLYAMGVLLYRWFSDRLPFNAPDPISVLGQILHEEAPALEPRLQLPSAAISLVRRLLSKNPDDRPASAGQVRAIWNQAFGSLSESAEREIVAPSLKALPLSPRFVGREHALEQAQCRLLEESAQGLNVIFTGAAGMGKTRALTELRDWAKRRRWKVLQTSASPLDILPFQPLLDPLRASLRFGVPASLESFRSELSLILPELVDDMASEQDTELNPMRRYRLFEGMRRVLLYDRRSTDQPVSLLTIEDLQYAGDETLEFLHFLKQRQEIAGPSLLVAASLSPGSEVSQDGSRLEQTLQSPHLLSVRLGPLDAESARRLILSMLGGGVLEELSLRAFIGQSEGNPLFLIEMTRAFLEEGRLCRSRQGEEEVWKLRLPSLSEASTTSTKIPDSLKSVVARRLKPLEPEDRELLKKAAFLGLRFSFTLLAAIAGRPEQDVFDRLLRLESKGLVKEGKSNDTFDFCNSVIPVVLLDAVQPAEKRLTHLQICRQALQQNPDDCDPFWLAWHYREAGDEGEAIRHLEKSADRALASFSFAQAAALYREVLATTSDLGELGIERSIVAEKGADALRFRGESAQAATTYLALLEATPAPSGANRLRLRRKLALVKDAQGESAECFRLLKKSWHDLGLTPLDSLEGNWSLVKLLKALTSSTISLTPKSRLPHLNPAENEEMMALAAELQRLLFFLRPSGWVQQSVEVALTQRRVKPNDSDPLASAQIDFNGGYLCLRLPKGWQIQSLRFLDSAMAKLSQAPPSFRRLEIQKDCGYLYQLAGRAERALEILTCVAEEAEQIGHLTALPVTYGTAASAAISMAHFEVALGYGWKGYHLAQATENRRDTVLATCQLVRAMLYLGRWSEALPLFEALQAEDFRQYPYLMAAWYQIQTEWEIWGGQPGGCQRAEALALQGLKQCEDLDEVRYYKTSLQVLLIESRLKQSVEKLAMSDDDWNKTERRMRHFPHLRFRIKLLKMMWNLRQGRSDLAQGLAEALLARDECNDFRRELILRETTAFQSAPPS